MTRRGRRATILIADDHTVVAEGLAEALRPHFSVVGQVTRLEHLLDAVRESQPEVVILDLAFEGRSSLSVLQEATDDPRIESRFVVLTAYASKALAKAAFRAGAMSFLLKGASTHELRLAIEAALEGRQFTAGEIDAATQMSEEALPGRLVKVGGIALRPKQIWVLNLLLDGLDRDAIGEELGISPKGAEYHLMKIRAALGTPNIRLLTLWATEHEKALRKALDGKGDEARLLHRRWRK